MKETIHTLKIITDDCIGCVDCMRSCPTKAIRIVDDKAIILSKLCIECGECITACRRRSIIPLTDSYDELIKVDRFKLKAIIPSPALYGQFQKNILPNDVLLALRTMGFDYVYDEARTCEICNSAIEEFLINRKERKTYISSACPVVTRLIQKRFSELTENIIPLDAPREVASKEIKKRLSKKYQLKENEIAVFYITPCSAKVLAIKSPPTKEFSTLNGAISISEIYGQILNSLKTKLDDEVFQQASGVGIGWSVSGGEIQTLKDFNCVAVSGIHNVITMLEDLENEKLRNIDYLECRACQEGCVGGNLTVDNRFLAKGKIQMLTKMFGEESRVKKEEVKELFRQGYFFTEKSPKPMPIPPMDEDAQKAIEKIQESRQILTRLKRIDCGACGSPDCESFAEDVVRGYSKIEKCLFLKDMVT